MTASAIEPNNADAPSTVVDPPRPGAGTTAADRFMLKVLRLPLEVEQPGVSSPTSEAAARSAFQTSIFISAVRCLLTYIILPFVAPLVGLAASIGEPLGIVVAVVAVVSIISSMRRFWSVRHKHRWSYTILGGVMLCFLMFLLATDISNL